MIQTKDRETGAGWAEKRETSEPWNGELQVGIIHSYRSTTPSQSLTPVTSINSFFTHFSLWKLV